MKIENGQLRLEATDDHDYRIMRVARRGVSTRVFDGIPITPQEDAVEERLFWAGRHAYSWEEGKQLALTEDTGCTFSADDAVHLVSLIEAGLKYTDGIHPKTHFWHKEIKYVNSMASEILRPNEALVALPTIQKFAGQLATEVNLAA